MLKDKVIVSQRRRIFSSCHILFQKMYNVYFWTTLKKERHLTLFYCVFKNHLYKLSCEEEERKEEFWEESRKLTCDIFLYVFIYLFFLFLWMQVSLQDVINAYFLILKDTSLELLTIITLLFCSSTSGSWI